MRTYIWEDALDRTIRALGFKLRHVMNITDVGHLTSDEDTGEDKMEKGARREGKTASEIAQFYTDAFMKDLKALNCRTPDVVCRATDHVPEMIDMIQKLKQKGFTYKTSDGIYFDTSKFPKYVEFARLDPEQLQAGSRIDMGEKRSNTDFALWKFSPKDTKRQMEWDSPWGVGFPGWHIECSAMSLKYLAQPIDIHCGGQEHIRVHHSNEIAQAEAATGKQFARYWLHIGLLTINGEKMSKSLGNIINVRDLLKTWDAEVIRMFFAQAHYRSPPDYSEKALSDVQKGLDRLYRLKQRLESLVKNTSHKKQIVEALTPDEQQYETIIKEFEYGFVEAMDDDFNTPKAFAALFEFVNASNSFFEHHTKINTNLCQQALDVYLKIGSVLTLFQPSTKPEKKADTHLISLLQILLKQVGGTSGSSYQDELLDQLLVLRNKARASKDWTTADTIRKELEKLGFEIQDTLKGSTWRRK